jgi:hypothetical protein
MRCQPEWHFSQHRKGMQEMHITIDGFSGGITAPNAEEATSLALTLLLEGYGVRVNALRVNVEYGPGYNSVVWGEGDYVGDRLS